MIIKDRKQCFVLFSRNVDKFCLKINKELKETIDFFVLSYSEDDEEAVDKLENKVYRTIYNKQSLSDTFNGCKPKFHNDKWKIMPGNLDLCQLKFVVDHPGYDYYWFCEDDVRYTGKFSSLIEEFNNIEHDLIATNRKKFLPGWWHKNSFKSGKHSVTPEESLFLPFFRISQSAAKMIMQAYKEGWAGHHEVSWLNILEYYKYKVSDFNDFNRVYYTSNSNKLGMGPGTFIYSPSKLSPGLKKNVLYHPVKPFPEYVKRQKKRYSAIIKNLFR